MYVFYGIVITCVLSCDSIKKFDDDDDDDHSIRQTMRNALVRRYITTGRQGPPPWKVPLPVGESGPHLIHGSLDPVESARKWHLDHFSVLHNLPTFPTHTHRHADHITCNRPHLHIACRWGSLIIILKISPYRAASTLQNSHFCQLWSEFLTFRLVFTRRNIKNLNRLNLDIET